MQVFEFHFNPKIKPDVIFDSFCYEPENIYEKRMGSLYIVGLLKNVLPKNTRFIEKLVKVIKDRYYRSTVFTPEKSLKENLKVANEYLEGLTKKGDVSWLGNLSFAVLSLRKFKLNFAKVGDIKILVARGGKIIDIEEKVNLQDIEPYPLKVFSNTVSGKLAEGDLIMVLTKDIFDFFQKQKILTEIAKLESFSKGSLKAVLNGKEKLLSDASGILLTIILTKEALLAKKETISPETLKEFSFKEVFTPILKIFKKVKIPPIAFPNILNIKKKLKAPKIKIPKIKLKLPEVKMEKPSFLNKQLGLIVSLIIILIFGFIYSKTEEERKIEVYNKDLEEIKENLGSVEGFLVLKETNPEALQKANLLLQDSWEKISSLSQKTVGLPKEFNDKVLSLKNEVSEKLSDLNKIEKIETPELLFKFEKQIFVPHRIAVFNNDLYFFSPHSKGIFNFKENGETKIIQTEDVVNLATVLEDSVLFLTKPSQVFLIEKGKDGISQVVTLETPYSDFNFNDVSSFSKNLYFLDKEAGQIIKYPFLRDLEWGSPVLWLNVQTTKVKGADSIVVDGSIWELNDNSIYEYYAGKLYKEVDFEVFPTPKEFSKISTVSSLSPYLYVLEPVQKRIIILTKEGELVKQFQSEKFDNLLDFAVSEDESTIYLLNGMSVYKIEL